MTRRNNGRRRRNNRGRSLNRNTNSLTALGSRTGPTITTQTGTGLITFAIDSTFNHVNIPLSPSALSTAGMTRLGEMMEGFQLFRFTELKMEILPQGVLQSDVDFYTLAYSPGIPDISGASATTNNVSQLADSINYTSSMTIPRVLTVPRSSLIADTPNKWYRTQPAAAIETWEEQQGQLTFCIDTQASSTLNFFIRCRYVIQFTSAIAPGNIPLTFPPVSDALVSFIQKRIDESNARRCLAAIESSKSLSSS